jgi:hypothetical protein
LILFKVIINYIIYLFRFINRLFRLNLQKFTFQIIINYFNKTIIYEFNKFIFLIILLILNHFKNSLMNNCFKSLFQSRIWKSWRIIWLNIIALHISNYFIRLFVHIKVNCKEYLLTFAVMVLVQSKKLFSWSIFLCILI